jgi:hypothetical protein
VSTSLADKLRTDNRAELDRLRAWLAAPAVDSPPGYGQLVETFAVSGSREWTDPRPVRFVLWHLPHAATMLHGAARGLDRMAAGYWSSLGGPVLPFPVRGEQWRTIGRAAGHVRNEIMLNRMPACLVAFHLGASPGTAGAIAYARSLGIPTFVFRS